MINGTSNPSGQPSFVQDLGAHLRLLGDSIALSFINQVGSAALNSPFGSSIALALQARYLSETSLRGFFDANINTLSNYSRDQMRFLRGDWSQGGAAAWFALTTQNNNNPYMLYQAAKSQMDNLVDQAQINRRQDLMQSGGFLSWCSTDAGARPAGAAVTVQAQCSDSDGNPGQIVTPGSIIHDYAQKAVVDSGLDQSYADLISANDVDAALGAMVSAIAAQALSGAKGLLTDAPSQSSSGRLPGITDTINNYVPSGTVLAQTALTTSQTRIAQVNSYTSSLNTILTATNAAAAGATDLMSFCSEQQKNAPSLLKTAPSYVLTNFMAASLKTISDAQTALIDEITPTLVQIQTAMEAVEATWTLALKVQKEAATTPVADPIQFSADVSLLAAMPPSALDVTNAQSGAQRTDSAVALPRQSSPGATPTISLTVTDGTLVDQMRLITANAKALKLSCDSQAALDEYYASAAGYE